MDRVGFFLESKQTELVHDKQKTVGWVELSKASVDASVRQKGVLPPTAAMKYYILKKKRGGGGGLINSLYSPLLLEKKRFSTIEPR